jgi:prevent-host-death family protein
MPVIDAKDARDQLMTLLDRVGRGERFVITRLGRPVARLVPPDTDEAVDVKETVRRMEQWQERAGPTLGPGLTSRDLREEGRRF